MRGYICLLIMALTFAVRAEVKYFATDSVCVPDGEIMAVEVRAANEEARVGEAKLAGWSITWPGVEISVSFDFRNYVDGISSEYATITCNNRSEKLSKGVNTSGGFNSVAIEWHPQGNVALLAGERKLIEVMILDSLPKPVGNIFVRGIGGDVTIQDIILDLNSDSFERLRKYRPEQLLDVPRWEYLDRINDPRTAIIGGEYILAQVGPDLVYLGGAKTNPSHWKPGMLKGTLKPTGFDGYYKLKWYDSTGREMPGENFAEHDKSLGVLKLSFPELGASIRLKLSDKE